MDQDAFRETYREFNENFCAFEKSILTNQCNCSQAEKFCIAEREGIRCHSKDGQAQCIEALEILRAQARFALRSSEEKRMLPHGKAIRIQVGGMRGIKSLVFQNDETPEQVPDIFAILSLAIEKYEKLDLLPFDGIMPYIAAYKGRSKMRKTRSKKRNPRNE